MAVTIATDALTTVANVRNYLTRPLDTDPTTTERLQIYINAYSHAIRRYTGRQFLPVETVSKRYRYDGSGYLSLSPSEAQSVSSVLLYSDLPVASQVTLPAQSATLESQFRLEPRNGTAEGTSLWMSLPELGQFSVLVPEPLVTRRQRGHEVTISGTWGAGVVPPDVELAALVAIANAFRNPEGFGSRSLGALAFTEMPEGPMADESGLSLPRDSRALLIPYCRRAYG